MQETRQGLTPSEPTQVEISKKMQGVIRRKIAARSIFKSTVTVIVTLGFITDPQSRDASQPQWVANFAPHVTM